MAGLQGEIRLQNFLNTSRKEKCYELIRDVRSRFTYVREVE
jgi:hypothetical protein